MEGDDVARSAVEVAIITGSPFFTFAVDIGNGNLLRLLITVKRVVIAR